MTAQNDTSRVLWTAGIVVGASLPKWLELPLWVTALLCVCVAWRLAAARRGWPLPGRIARLLLAFLAFCGVLLEYRTINGIEAGGALLVVMVALKFLESRTARDQLVLIIIAYFLMFVSLLTERSLLTAVYLFVLVWLTTVGLLQLGRRGALLPSAVTARLAGRLLLHAVPLMIVLFVLFPRLPGALWAAPITSRAGITGLSDTMSPGDITELGLSDEVAFRVEFTSAAPPPGELYWRGPVLMNFNGRTWSRAEGTRRNVQGTVEPLGDTVDYRVMLEPNRRGWVFALDMPVSWSAEGRSVRMNSDYQLGVFFGESRPVRFDYRATSYTRYRALEPLSPREQEIFSRLPPDSSPRARELAASWLVDDPSAEEIIARGLRFLRTQPFFYTLTPPPLGAQPVDDFLFGTREGFCEHYASAFTVLMRAAGLPARVVTGYQGGELNGVAGYYIVRQADAHAWTEVWLDEQGWIRVDPTSAVAPERVSLGSSRASLDGSRFPGGAFASLQWLRDTRLIWDVAQMYWYEWIMGYGVDKQRALIEAFGFASLDRGQRWATLMMLTVAASFVLLLTLGMYLAWRRRTRTQDRATRYFAQFCRRLSRLSVAPRAPHEAPADYARRAQAALPAAAPEIAAIVDAYLRARYEPDADGAQLDTLRRRLARFRPRGVPEARA